MIYTLTVNPSLDYILDVKDFNTGKTNRSFTEQLIAGGKGINVSIVLKNLDISSVSLGFTAGFTGDEIERQLNSRNISTDFIRLKNGSSRINVKLRSSTETEINACGPDIQKEELDRLFEKLSVLKKDDVLVLAGSIPASLPQSLYSDILESLKGKEILTVVDASGKLLTGCLKYKPFLIKPNNHELSEIFGCELNTRQDVIPYAQKLIEQGARNVLVSLAEKGAVLVDHEKSVYESSCPKIELINSVGAGDSMVAGFIASFQKHKDIRLAFRTGIAAGSASAAREGLAEKSDIEKLLSLF